MNVNEVITFTCCKYYNVELNNFMQQITKFKMKTFYNFLSLKTKIPLDKHSYNVKCFQLQQPLRK